MNVALTKVFKLRNNQGALEAETYDCGLISAPGSEAVLFEIPLDYDGGPRPMRFLLHATVGDMGGGVGAMDLVITRPFDGEIVYGTIAVNGGATTALSGELTPLSFRAKLAPVEEVKHLLRVTLDDPAAGDLRVFITVG